jgi:adenylate kinase family enzyme
MPVVKRILILGPSGAGKSTLARRIVAGRGHGAADIMAPL